MALCKKMTILPLCYVIIILFFGQGFRADPRFLTARDKAYKRVVNDTSIFKVSQQPLIISAFGRMDPHWFWIAKCWMLFFEAWTYVAVAWTSFIEA